MSEAGYDIIGDIHGHAAELERLLEALGYRLSGPVYHAPPGRRAVFLGDFINRGPGIPRVLHIVRNMLECGEALAIMGNHEFNALACAADCAGAKISQEADSLAAFGEDWQQWESHLTWFKTLPLYLDLGELRIAHAFWSDDAITALESPSFSSDLLRPRGAAPDARQAAADLLLRGPEFPLPPECVLPGGRSKIRLKWWLQNAAFTFKAAGLSAEELPDIPLPAEARAFLNSYSPDAPPLFFGHYGYPKPPEPMTPKLACIDLGIARGGPLAAYRWRGERELRATHYLTVR